jgi:hypothetical protein
MKMSSAIDSQLMFPSAFKIGPYKAQIIKKMGMLMIEIAPSIKFTVFPGT